MSPLPFPAPPILLPRPVDLGRHFQLHASAFGDFDGAIAALLGRNLISACDAMAAMLSVNAHNARIPA